MAETPVTYAEGQTATAKDKKSRVVYRGGMWVNDTTYQAPGSAADSISQDLTALLVASNRAAAERDAQRTYSQAAGAVRRMGTGPARSMWLDAITPDEDGWPVFDGLGAFLGTPWRDRATTEARDQLKTVNAGVSLAASQQMKGSSSDRDVALMRMSGIGPAKTEAENNRIIREASYSSGMAQTRALTMSNWIARYGSTSKPSSNGMTFEENLRLAEGQFDKRYKARLQGRPLPAPPPRRRGGSQETTVTIDLNGNPVR